MRSGWRRANSSDDLARSVGRAVFADEDFVVERRFLRQGALQGGGDEGAVVVGDDERSNPHCVEAISVSDMARRAAAWH